MDAPARCIQCNADIHSCVDAVWLWEDFSRRGWQETGPFHNGCAAELVEDDPDRFKTRDQYDNTCESDGVRAFEQAMQDGGADDSRYRRDMTDAGRGHLLR